MAWLLALCTPVFAQGSSGQWVGDLYMVSVYPREPDSDSSCVFIDEEDNVHSVIPNVKTAMDGFPEAYRGRGGGIYSHWLGDALYGLGGGRLENNGDDTYFRRWAFAKWQDGEWRFLAGLRTSDRAYLHCLPCDGDRFILVSSRMDLYDDARQDMSPFCRASVREGKEELHIDASIDHGQDDLRKYMTKHLTELGQMEYWGEAMKGHAMPSYSSCFEMISWSSVIMTEGGATLINKGTGLYWVFSTKTARLVKAGNIFKNVTPEMVANGGFDSAVLCANPEKSGTVLVSAQDENLFVQEKKTIHSEANELFDKSQVLDEDVWDIFFRLEEDRKIRSPLIVWYRIYPDDGRVERLAEPPEGGASVRDGWKNDYWRPMPDGSVKMGWDTDKLKAQVSKRAGSSDVECAAKEADGAVSDPTDKCIQPEGEGGDKDKNKGELKCDARTD